MVGERSRLRTLLGPATDIARTFRAPPRHDRRRGSRRPMPSVFRVEISSGHCRTVAQEVPYCVRSSRHHNLCRYVGVHRNTDLVATLKHQLGRLVTTVSDLNSVLTVAENIGYTQGLLLLLFSLHESTMSKLQNEMYPSLSQLIMGCVIYNYWKTGTA